mgnify:CR=1 FL=1
MTDHLPECPRSSIPDKYADAAAKIGIHAGDCICEPLRACEQRVRREDDDYAYVAAQAEADGRRRDWNFGRLHVIRRSYTEPQQYGWLLWGIDRPYSTTLDVWFKQTLWTFRIGKPWE